MADEQTTTTTAATDEPAFEAADVAKFDQDDSHAGSVIGKMLAFFFLYTVIVMACVGWWTYQAITN